MKTADPFNEKVLENTRYLVNALAILLESATINIPPVLSLHVGRIRQKLKSNELLELAASKKAAVANLLEIENRIKKIKGLGGTPTAETLEDLVRSEKWVVFFNQQLISPPEMSLSMLVNKLEKADLVLTER